MIQKQPKWETVKFQRTFIVSWFGIFNIIIIQVEVLSIFALASLIKESNVEVIVVEEERRKRRRRRRRRKGAEVV